MGFETNLLLVSATALLMLSVASLLQKLEFLRGLGRVCDGGAWTLTGALLLVALKPDSPIDVLVKLGCAGAFIAGGVITAALGARKYLRSPEFQAFCERRKNCADPTGESPIREDDYAQRFEVRPEYGLFGDLIRKVVDASRVRKHKVNGLYVFKMDQVFRSKNAAILGFGVPNAFLVVRKDGLPSMKYAAYSLWRKESEIVDTRGFIQAGIELYFPNLDDETLRTLRKAMELYEGTKGPTCVNSVCKVMDAARIRLGNGQRLHEIIFPYQLFRALRKHGLMRNGKRLEFQMARTSPDSVERFLFNVIRAEFATFRRHAGRKIESLAEKNKVLGAALAKWNGFVQSLGVCHKPKEQKFGPVAPALPPLPNGEAYPKNYLLSVSKPPLIGCILRQAWGPHILFKVDQEDVNINCYQPETLEPFNNKSQGIVTFVKQKVLFSPVAIKLMRLILAPKFVPVGYVSEKDLYDMLRTDSEEAPNKYNYVVDGSTSSLIIARLNVDVKLIDWILSKHILLLNYGDGRCGGEMFKTADGSVHWNDNSGTLAPKAQHFNGFFQFALELFPRLKNRMVKEGRA